MVRKYMALSLITTPPVPAHTDDLTGLLEALKAMDFDRLTAYAGENSIDLGQATTQSGAYKKIAAHLTAEGTKDVPENPDAQ